MLARFATGASPTRNDHRRIAPQRARILHQYVDPVREHGAAAGVFAAVVAFCVAYGMSLVGLATNLGGAVLAPELLLGLLVIWALPDRAAAVGKNPSRLMFLFVAALVLWPNYLAIALPGMPWITVVRLTGFPLAIALLVLTSTSRAFRSETAAVLRSAPLIPWLLLGFSGVAALSIAFSDDQALSLQHFVLAQVLWTAVFFISANLFLTEGRAMKMAGLLWGLAIVVGVIGVLEWRAQKVLWVGHIPSFLKIEDPSVARTLSPNFREGGAYRAEATFTTPLGLGEYLALSLPFVLHFAVVSRRLIVRVLAIGSCPFILLVAGLSGARLGLVGGFTGILLYLLAWAVLRWRREERDLLGVAVVLGYPAIFCAAVTASFVVGRVHNVVWGDGSQDSSNQARIDQWIMGIPKILDQPWGYGIGMGSLTLKYHPYGVLTIDSYYLDLLLEVGIVGFVLYYGMLISAIWYAARTLWRRRDLVGELGLLAPASIALTAFVIEKSVFSEQDNHPLVFMLMGMIAALAYRAHREGAPPDAPDRLPTTDRRPER